jgi:hypothetical protein
LAPDRVCHFDLVFVVEELVPAVVPFDPHAGSIAGFMALAANLQRSLPTYI